MGYHPVERVEPYAGEYGPYPLTVDELVDMLIVWGIGTNVRALVRTTLTTEDPTR